MPVVQVVPPHQRWLLSANTRTLYPVFQVAVVVLSGKFWATTAVYWGGATRRATDPRVVDTQERIFLNSTTKEVLVRSEFGVHKESFIRKTPKNGKKHISSP